MTRRLASSALGLWTLLHATAAFAQAPSPIVANLSLDELNNLRVTIASVVQKPIREQPGIVTIITEQEIADIGAVDLADVLTLVPGFSFGADVDAVIGLDFRGLWAYEGKILVLLDGIPLNEGLYGTVPMGRHYSAALIKQVEIVRGPGSARYGGNAELAVISITTKGADQNGGVVSVRPEIASGRAGAGVDASLGYTLANGWRWSLGARYEDFLQSDQRYVSLDGKSVDMKDRSSMTPAMLNAAVGWNGLDSRVVFDNYEFDNPTGFGNPSLQTTPWAETFRSVMGSVKYDWKATEAVTISPRVIMGRQHPWWLHTSVGQGDFEIQYDKWTFDVPAVVALNGRNHLLAGMTGYTEDATALQTSPFFGQASPATFFQGSDHVRYRDVSVYAQYDLDTAWANLTVGGRYENHDYAGGAFVPRIGVTRAWKQFHVKALFDQAFRTPNIETIQQRFSHTSVTYEKTTGYQLEAGYRFSDLVSVVANLYDTSVDKPLAFTVASTTMFGYVNGSTISSHGGEVELRYASDPVSAYVGYSYYDADDQLSAAQGLYGSSQPGLNLALPAHKISFLGTYHVNRRLTCSLSGSHLATRRAYAFPAVETALPDETSVNTHADYRAGPTTVSIAVRNLLNEPTVVGQPYNGGSAPLPLLGRNYALTVAFRF